VVYRDDRQALSLQVAELERENEQLREELESVKSDARRERDERHEERKAGAFRGCALCGGSLLPVAVFAGQNHRSPLPLNVSTLRFGDPSGGFTGSAPIKSKVCSSCGFIHQFIDINAPDAMQVTDAAARPAQAESNAPDDSDA
jgi:hypothetical protein